MKRQPIDDPAVVVAILFGIEGATVLSFVEDEESGDDAFGIVIEMPLADTCCPICGGDAVEVGRVLDELPPTTAGPADALIAWVRRQWRCGDEMCPQEIFDEENDEIDRFVERVAPQRRSKELRRLRKG